MAEFAVFSAFGPYAAIHATALGNWRKQRNGRNVSSLSAAIFRQCAVAHTAVTLLTAPTSLIRMGSSAQTGVS